MLKNLLHSGYAERGRFFKWILSLYLTIMSKNLRHQEYEPLWRKYWEETNIYKFDSTSNKPIFSIDNPPPTISGQIHIGHIFSYTQTEIVARFKRMNGYNVFYPFWFDDNGLPTERLVEKEIGKKWADMPRQDFINICLATTKKYREEYKELWKSTGISADWSLEYSTISAFTQKISQKSFIELYKKWLIYKKSFPALRCPECQTSVAQAEVEDKEIDTIFYWLNFTLENWDSLPIATTRPELLPACVAIFINPTDERYKKYIGSNVTTPLGEIVRIIADEKVLIEKWTGVVMCCTYGDETDVYRKESYNLPEKIILDKAWRIINTSHEELIGLSTLKARKAIIEKLRAEWKILKEIPLTHAVGCHERCGTPMEFLPISQRFISILSEKEKFLEIWNQINRYPEYMHKRYDEWVKNLKRDRCISRQRFFGIPIPVWYSKKTGEIIVPEMSDLPIDPSQTMPTNLPEWHTHDDIIAETDVLDTRATSWLSPLINAHWWEKDDLSEKILPMTLRTQAHEIIRTWTFYTIVETYYHTKQLPWKDIMISWYVADSKWDKISKSKGNAGKSPGELISIYGADAIRYRTTNGQIGKDIKLDENEFKAGLKLVTKLENAANFVFMNLTDFKPETELTEKELCSTDLWILAQANKASQEMTKYFENYELSSARSIFEKFFRHDFCDYYLEIVKDRIYNPDKYTESSAQKLSGQFTLYRTLFAIIKMLAPMLPFITEDLYQKHYKSMYNTASIHTFTFPNDDIFSITQDTKPLYDGVNYLFQIIEETRTYKTEKKIWLGTELSAIGIHAEEKTIALLQSFINDIKSVTRAKDIYFTENKEFSIEMK